MIKGIRSYVRFGVRRISVARYWTVAAAPALATELLALLIGALAGYFVSTLPSDLLRRYAVPAMVLLTGLLLLVLVWQARRREPMPRRWAGSPYPGLDSFAESYSEVFFGREAEVSQLTDRLHPLMPAHSHRFVAVIGSSGAGKSSLVQAGLIPRLRRPPENWLILPIVLPGDDPWRNLANSFGAHLPRERPSRIAVRLRESDDAVAKYVNRIRTARKDPAASVLLVVDQAEELFTQTGHVDRGAFLRVLRAAIRADKRLWVVATLRSEFLTGFLEEGFEDLFRNATVIGTLPRDNLFQVIERPAELAGVTFEAGVVNRLIDGVDVGDALPLLAYTLSVLYSNLNGRRIITLDDYELSGGVAGALPEQADRTRAELETQEDAAPTLPTLLKFVSFSPVGGEAPTRRRVHLSALTQEERRVVEYFVQGRLLSTEGGGADAAAHVAHEALFREWAPLRSAIEAKASALQRRAELERLASDWEHSGRKDSYLVTGERLRELLAAAQGDPEVVADLSRVEEFLELSARSDKAALEKLANSVARRARETIPIDPELALLLSVAAIDEGTVTPGARAALTAALTAFRLRGVLLGHADTVRAVAWAPDTHRVASGGEDGHVRIWEGDRPEGALDWVAPAEVRSLAWSPVGKWLAVGLQTGAVAIWNPASGDVRVSRPHADAVTSIDWSQRGAIATASEDGTAQVWDPNGAEKPRVFRHSAGVRGVAWSASGRRIATACRDHAARIWDLEESASPSCVLDGHDDWVESVAWSPDGRRVATSSADWTACIWDPEGGAELARLRGHADWVQGVAWSPDGKRVATSSRDKEVRIWDAVGGVPLDVLRGHGQWVHRVAWAPDPKRLATASYDRSVRIWDADAVTSVLYLPGHSRLVQAVAWSGDATRLATASHDQTAKVWDTSSGVELESLQHDARVHGVAWSPDGTRVATAAGDHKGRIWQLGASDGPCVLQGHTNWVENVSWSPDGTRVATGSNDGTARIFDAETGTCRAVLEGHEGWVRGVAWSRDGTCIATASYDGTARIWGRPDDGEPTVLRGHSGWVNAVDWSPDGKRIVTASHDQTARIWDAASGKEVGRLEGHVKAIHSIAWSPDGRRIASASNDGTSRTWDAETFTELSVPCIRRSSVEGVAWAPGSRRIATASEDATVHVWDASEVDFDTLLERARARCFRPLTPEERTNAML